MAGPHPSVEQAQARAQPHKAVPLFRTNLLEWRSIFCLSLGIAILLLSCCMRLIEIWPSSITLELIGVTKQDIARHVGWRTPAMVDHYNHLHEALLVTSPASVLAAGKLPTGEKTAEECVASYKQFNYLSGFHQVFG